MSRVHSYLAQARQLSKTVSLCLLYWVFGLLRVYTTMAPKARRSAVVVPALPVALKTLKAHHVLNGRLLHRWDPLSRTGYSYYKHQGISKQTAKKVAVYLLHCPAEEHADWWERMANLGTTPTNFTKVIAEYQHECAQLVANSQQRIRSQVKREQNTSRVQPLVADASGKLH